MPPGRPPKPVEAKRRTGNPGKRALPAATVTSLPTTATPPAAPAHLGDDGQAFWQLASESAPWIGPSDRPLLVLVAEAFDERARLRREVQVMGTTFQTEKGYVGLQPAVSQLRAVEEQIVKWLSLLGLSPADRTRIGLEVVRSESRLEQLLAARTAARIRPTAGT